MSLHVTSDDSDVGLANNVGIDGGNITFGAWVRFEQQPTPARVICWQKGASTDVTYGLRYEGAAGTTLTFLRDRNGIATFQVNYTVTFNLNQWYHIAASWDGGTGKIYVDGLLVQSATDAGGNGNDGLGNDFRAGADNSASYLVGKLAHVFCYDTALSIRDIKRILLSRPPADDPNLRVYWPLDQSSGTTANDYSMQRSFNGTITTATWSTIHPPTSYK